VIVARLFVEQQTDDDGGRLSLVEFSFNSSWSDKGGYFRTEGQMASNFVKATKLVTADGAQGPIFWFTLHGNNPDSPGYGLITRDSQDLSRRRLKAFYGLRDMPAPQPVTTGGTASTSSSSP
jgi:hypothetical protein